MFQIIVICVLRVKTCLTNWGNKTNVTIIHKWIKENIRVATRPVGEMAGLRISGGRENKNGFFNFALLLDPVCSLSLWLFIV